MKTLNIKSSIMKTTLLVLLLFTGMANAQIVAIPDAAFKAKLIALGVDTNSDGNIQNSEASAVTSLVMKDSNIAVLDGIEAFTNLTELDVMFNILSALDLSALTNLVTLNCNTNQISLLNVSGLTNLENLNCGNNKLSALDVAGLTNLKTLQCNMNLLTSLNVTGLANLQTLGIGHNPMASISSVVGVNSNLEELYLDGLNLTTINVTAFPNLKVLSCVQNMLPSLSAITGLTPNLEVLYCFINQMTTIDVTAFPYLKKLYCHANSLTALNVTGLANLEVLDCGQNQLTTLNISGLTNLEYVRCNDNQLTDLNLTGLVNLKDLSTHFNPLLLDLAGLTSLKNLVCSYNQIPGVDFSVIPTLTSLYIYGGTGPATLNLTGLSNITELNCGGLGLTGINLTGLINLQTLTCPENQLTALDLSGLDNLKSLTCRSNQLTALDLTGINNLELLDCGQNQLTSLNTTAMPALKYLYANNNVFPSLNLTGNGTLEVLSTGFNNLTNLDLSGNANLRYLNCSSNQITALNLTANPKLIEAIARDNQLASLQLNPETLYLRQLIYSNNPLPNFDYSTYTELVRLDLDNTGSTILDVSNHKKLFYLNCYDNPIPTIDVSNNYKLEDFGCGSAELTHLFMKNGADENLTIHPSPNLQFTCTDDSQALTVQNLISDSGNTTCVVNSYCTFVPGGDYNTITGSILFDANSNGCDVDDIQQPNIKININDGTNSGDTFTNSTGTYNFFTLAGSFDITPEVENPSFFNFSPASATVPFLDNNNNVTNQGFCITANGVHPDIEIAVAPVGTARPGFDATYQIVFKNIGNQTLSGDVTFGYNDAILDFISASQTPDTTVPNLMTWNYTNLLPFENRSYTVILNLNSPVETPAVNINELLSFTANVNPVVGDENTLNNQFILNQITVGSYDPNDIVCLEGSTVSADEIGNYIHYIVNFQNTGTAAAENVVVKLAIDSAEFDVSSMQLMNTSHAVYTVVTNGIVEFKFPSIFLEATAGDPPVGGHGTILFKIKTLGTLTVGSEVSNLANIYFDYNAPIETNRAETIFETLSRPEFLKDESVILYPNPTTGMVNLNCDNTIILISIYDVEGRVLETVLENKEATVLDISARSSGIYFVKIETENGVRVEKVVKE